MSVTANHRSSLILASTSRYRAQLLQRLGCPFESISPHCDETPTAGESPADLVRRLAIAKAESVAVAHPDAVVIGSDQVADLAGTIIGKPADHNDAVAQLQAISGRQVVFRTGLCMTRWSSSQQYADTVITTVKFRTLSASVIHHYLQADQPYDCACSFRSESLGSAIVESMTSDDPTALIGLPIIRVAAWLNQFGLEVP